ncbi:hypothetical protein Scep_024472 [Stephania cephalantha]|uniref:Uncharacterized protein n=1 Tax=Stephania cephalantha TaxID=152367 RepID=A0AAP0F241_9MAGN
MLRCEELKNGTDVYFDPSLSLNPFSPPTIPSLPPQISLSKPHPPPVNSLFLSLDRFLFAFLFVSLSLSTDSPSTLFSLSRNLSPKPLNRRTVCRRYELSSRPPEVVPSAVAASEAVAAASEAIVVCLRPLPRAVRLAPPVAVVRRCLETIAAGEPSSAAAAV